MMKPYKVLICDDQNMPRQLFSMIVESAENYELVGQLSSAKRALEFCATHVVDLVLMDIVMADGSDGLETAGEIKKAYPKRKVLIVTSMPESGYLKRARQMGIDSFWYKEVADEPLLSVMDKTMEGERVFPDSAPAVDIGWAKSNEFTERELEVLRALTTGATDPEIAQQLDISLPTVRTHIRHMTDKTGLSRVRLAIEARLHGIAIGN